MRNEKNQRRVGVKVVLPLPAWAKPDTVLGTVESAKANKDMRAIEKAIKSKRK